MDIIPTQNKHSHIPSIGYYSAPNSIRLVTATTIYFQIYFAIRPHFTLVERVHAGTGSHPNIRIFTCIKFVYSSSDDT